MAFVNNVMIIRRDLITRMAELYKEDQLFQQIDRIPLEISGRLSGHERCCVYKMRAVVKYKIMAILGFGRKDEKDELDSLAYYAEKTINSNDRTADFLTVVDEACTSCVKANYVITNLCKGCIAQPCMNNCPKKAISRTPEGKAIIDTSTCVNCGICKDLCPYHSIIYMPVPCEESCPVGAISKDENGIENINQEKCILCGKCVNACPFGSILETTELFEIMDRLKQQMPITAVVAPSLFGQFRAEPGAVLDALYKLGFTNVVEAAEGAFATTRLESEELIHSLDSGQAFMTTSCCPSWVMAAQKHIPEILPFVSITPSPMAISAKMCKEQFPSEPVVFIGPCIAKRNEGRNNPDVDWVMTFEELACLFTGWGISVVECENRRLSESVDQQSRNYCLSGGVASAVQSVTFKNISSKVINGLDRKQLKLLSSYAKAQTADSQLIEVMACEGGCISGPCSHEFPKDAKRFFIQNTEKICC